MENRKHWIFKKHTSNISLLIDLALYLKANKSGVSKEEKELMYNRFSKTGLYNPRNSLRDKPLDAINHKLDGLSYYMFGYSDTIENKKKFIFSPLGNLFLKNIDDKDALSKIFSTMLIGIQFPHPSSAPSEKFFLYPFRLIFSLLLDDRLQRKLYNYEIYEFIIYQKNITEINYSELVDKILKSRKLTEKEKLQKLKDQEFMIVKSAYEWQYYTARILEEMQIIEMNRGDSYVELFHPKKENSQATTKRKINNGYFSLHKKVYRFVKNLLQNYSVFEKPLLLANTKKRSDDVVKEIYSFFPRELLIELGEVIDDFKVKLLELPKMIEIYSQNPENKTSDEFENILEEAFNMFINVDAKKISGSGNTDIECVYLKIGTNEKFAVEAKSTANKLKEINSGRLKRHRELIGAEYTVVVTPRYVPSVKFDISGENIVIIKANTFSEYIYNYIVSGMRMMDYGEIHEIIMNNLGNDISVNISELTLKKFG